MKPIKKDYLLLLLMLFFSIGNAQEPPSSEDYNYNTFEAQKKWIVGTFVSDDDSTWKLRFTKEGKCYWYLPDREPWIFTYTIEYSTKKSDVPAGYENIYTLYLKAIPSDPNEDLTYDMYVADDGLVLYPWGHGGQFTFERVKGKSTSSKTPLEKPQTAEEAYDAGYDDCKKRKSWRTSLRNQEYKDDYERGWGEAGCPLY